MVYKATYNWGGTIMYSIYFTSKQPPDCTKVFVGTQTPQGLVHDRPGPGGPGGQEFPYGFLGPSAQPDWFQFSLQP